MRKAATQTELRLHDRVLSVGPSRPALMGIVNASPESFSDDGTSDLGCQISEAVLTAGAHIINDVSGLRDVAIAHACAEHGAALVIMHTRVGPKVKAFPAYGDVVADVTAFLAERMDLAERCGVARDSIVLDPGPDFAKTPAQTVAVLQALPGLATLGRPLLLAASRKDFIGALTGQMPRDRLAGTLAALGAGLDGGAALLRVHDVRAAADYLAVRAALDGAEPVPEDLALAEHLRREPATISR